MNALWVDTSTFVLFVLVLIIISMLVHHSRHEKPRFHPRTLHHPNKLNRASSSLPASATQTNVYPSRSNETIPQRLVRLSPWYCKQTHSYVTFMNHNQEDANTTVVDDVTNSKWVFDVDDNLVSSPFQLLNLSFMMISMNSFQLICGRNHFVYDALQNNEWTDDFVGYWTETTDSIPYLKDVSAPIVILPKNENNQYTIRWLTHRPLGLGQPFVQYRDQLVTIEENSLLGTLCRFDSRADFFKHDAYVLKKLSRNHYQLTSLGDTTLTFSLDLKRLLVF